MGPRLAIALVTCLVWVTSSCTFGSAEPAAATSASQKQRGSEQKKKSEGKADSKKALSDGNARVLDLVVAPSPEKLSAAGQGEGGEAEVEADEEQADDVDGDRDVSQVPVEDAKKPRADRFARRAGPGNSRLAKKRDAKPDAPPPPGSMAPASQPITPRRPAPRSIVIGTETSGDELDQTNEEEKTEKDDKDSGLRARLGTSRDGSARGLAGYYSDGEEDRFRHRPLPNVFEKPRRLLPRMFYFEPTYQGGNAGVMERLRRLKAQLPDARQRILDLARSHPQDFDAPGVAGIGLSARLATPWLNRPQRVLLQVGLQGSTRYGWRRPPLDVVLVLDAPLMKGTLRAANGLIRSAIARLGVLDRLGIIVVTADGGSQVVAPVQRIATLEVGLDRMLERLPRAGPQTRATPAAALAKAGQLLRRAATEVAQVPGTQTVWLVTAGEAPHRVNAASAAADALTRAGVVTSVIEMGAGGRGRRGAWWPVASKGHGNYHRPERGQAGAAIGQELDALSKVVARLLRVNVRLASGVGAVRVIGSRVLDPDEVTQLKAREKAVDVALSKTLGVKADRGDDDDGIQTNIPYFYGGDSHVILVELWVERPGAVADVTIKYKDMVNLRNATAQVSVAIDGTPQSEIRHLAVARNYASFSVAEALIKAGFKVKHGRSQEAHAMLAKAAQLAPSQREVRMVRSFQAWLTQGGSRALSDALVMAGRRQIGQPPATAQAGGAP